jgi:ElaB/YqjD/DUF883 family membrane-anchored ribosome-binding protein
MIVVQHEPGAFARAQPAFLRVEWDRRINIMTRNIIGRRERVTDDLRSLISDSEQLLREVAGELTDRGKQARARLTSTLESAKATCRDLQDKAVARVESADEYAHEHPYKLVGLAFGVGVLLGVLAGSRRWTPRASNDDLPR